MSVSARSKTLDSALSASIASRSGWSVPGSGSASQKAQGMSALSSGCEERRTVSSAAAPPPAVDFVVADGTAFLPLLLAAAGRPYSRSSCVILQQRRGSKKKTCSEEEEEEPRIASAALGEREMSENGLMPGKGPRPHKTFLTATTQTKRLPLSSSPSPPRSVHPFPAFAFERVSHTLLHHASPLHGPYLRPRGLPPLQPGQGGSGGAVNISGNDDDEWTPRLLPSRQRHRRQGEFCHWRPLLLALDSALSCRGAGGERPEGGTSSSELLKGHQLPPFVFSGRKDLPVIRTRSLTRLPAPALPRRSCPEVGADLLCALCVAEETRKQQGESECGKDQGPSKRKRVGTKAHQRRKPRPDLFTPPKKKKNQTLGAPPGPHQRQHEGGAVRRPRGALPQGRGAAQVREGDPVHQR